MNPSTLQDDDFYPLIEARHCDPFKILGVRKNGKEWDAHVLRPDAAEITVVDLKDSTRRFPLKRLNDEGLFEAALPGVDESFAYNLELKSHAGDIWTERDPYSFGPVLGDMDVYLFNEGTHYEIYRKLGAHIINIGDVQGVHFAVWAPNAQRVSVVGDFNNWDGRLHPMRKMIPAGIWEIFLPGVKEGSQYKFEVRGPHGDINLKTDPFALYAQHTSSTSCMVYDIGRYGWDDAAWMKKRAE